MQQKTVKYRVVGNLSFVSFLAPTKWDVANLPPILKKDIRK